MNNTLELKKINKIVSYDEIIRILKIKNDDVVFASGSLIEGMQGKYSQKMGNSNSDLDIFIIRSHESYGESKSVLSDEVKKTCFAEIDGLGYDVEIYDECVIQKLIKAISLAEYSQDKKSESMIKLPAGWKLNDANLFLNCFYYSIVLQNEKKYTELREHTLFSHFLKFEKAFIINLIDNFIEDVVGNLKDGSEDTALFVMRDIVVKVAAYLIMCEGEFINKDKWAILKLKNVINKTGKYQKFIDLYDVLFLRNMQNSKEIEDAVRWSLQKTNEILDDLLLDELL